MSSKRQKCAVIIQAFRLFLAAALLAGLVGMTDVVYATDGAGNALDFDGTDDYVQISDDAALDANLGDSFTIEAWIKTRENDNSMIFAKHSGGTSGSYYLATSSGGQLQLTVLTSTGGRQDHAVSFSYNDGKWHHVAGVYNGSDLRIYVDGAQVGAITSQTGNVNDTTYPVRIGFYDGSPDWFYDGLYDEIRLWDDARTQTEIQANMHKTLAGSESGLVGYWKFDESSGTTATDSKGSNNGTLNNMEDSDWVTSGAFAGPRNALNFDGSDDDVSVTDPSALQITGDLTIEAWVYADAIRSDEWQNVIVRCTGDGSEEEVDNYVYALLLQDDGTIKTLWEYGCGSNEDNTSTSSSPSVATGSWFHVAMARDVSDNELRIYINGSQLGSTISYTNDPSGGSNGNFHIGSNEFGNNFDGMIDEVRIWNDVRTQTEIQDNMFRTLDGNESGLAAYYRFDYGTAGGSNAGITTLYDLSSNSNDGTLNYFALSGSTSNWVSSSAFNTWIGSESTSWSTTSNWSRNSVPGTSDNVGVYSYTGGNSPSTSDTTTVNHLTIATDATLTCGGNLTVNGNLSVASGGMLDVGAYKISSVGGNLTNNGTLSDNETKSVTLGSPKTFLDGQSNNAVYMTSGDSDKPGNTTVTARIGSTIPANAFGSSCPAAANSVKRYYNVTADTSSDLNVTLRLYYDDAELNGNTEGSLDIYHCESGSWVKESGTYSRDGSNNYVEVTGVDSFSPFILSGGNPTAVTLRSFTARPVVDTWFLAALALVALGAVGGALMLRRMLVLSLSDRKDTNHAKKRRFKMRNKYMLIGVVAGVLLASVVVVLAGTNFDAPSGPTDSTSQMYTLEQVYDRINDGTSATKMTTFDEPDSGPAATMHDLNAIYDLASERSRPAKTGQTTSYGTGTDGNLQKGVAWPSPRFTDNGVTITDNLTGLMWAENANLDGSKTWSNAPGYCNSLSLGGYTDWRLPNVRELQSLIDYEENIPALPSGHPFDNVQSDYYWSSTSSDSNGAYAWRMYLRFGNVDTAAKTSSYYVWPVRGGQ